MSLTLPLTLSWTQRAVVDCGVCTLMTLQPQVLMSQMFSETGSGSPVDLWVASVESWVLVGPAAGNWNPDATVSAAPQRCGLA